MRNAFITTLAELAKKDTRIVLITADMGFSVFERFMDQFPERTFNTGVAEQNSVGIAAGLALSGKIVFVYTIATFATMRPLEQIRTDACYQNLPVKIVGAGGGLTYGPQGSTHHATDDIAFMRAMPNMTVLCPGDPFESELCVRAAYRLAGPCYLRLGRGGGDPQVHKSAPKFQVGKGITVREGKDATLISTGNMLVTAVAVAEALARHKIGCGVVSMPTVKPLDAELVRKLAAKPVFTIEEHSIIGGLGSAVAEVLAEGDEKAKFRRFGLPDAFCTHIGSQEHMRKFYGLDAASVASEIRRMLARER